MPPSSYYHVIPLSNFARGYDKYRRCYDKARLSESTYPGQFFVLKREDLSVGIEKVSRLIDRLKLHKDRLLVLEATLPSTSLFPNKRTGLGQYLEGSALPITRLWFLDAQEALVPVTTEEAYAASLITLNPVLPPFQGLTPRTLSVLPIARACQAACAFCFSESSASLEQVPSPLNLSLIDAYCRRALAAGASRFVITGGGEPGLLAHTQLLALIRTGRSYFDKVVLITNGVHLSKQEEQAGFAMLSDYEQAGLTVLSISRHHNDPARNKVIMGLDTRTEKVLGLLKGLRKERSSLLPAVQARLICVLQQGGVENEASLRNYVDWAVGQGVTEICFKELYVASTLESVYHTQKEHQWSQDHQVPLLLVTSFFANNGFAVVTCLPWGAPVFEGTWHGIRLRVAAYTEPNVFWERSNGVARSWNVMADGTCLVSLEDPTSTLVLPGARRVIALKESRD
ncbi:MAG: radical SAM protein [Agitococcus sp.]|nr:radical SAM protein [Agitococcus sp.]